MKKWSILLTIFFFSLFFCSLKYGNMIRISNMSFCRFCCKNEKIDWPKCARTLHGPCTFHFNKKNEKNDKCCEQFCRFFCAGTIVLLAWKPLSYPPPPLFSYQLSHLLLLPRTLSNILHFHGRYGTVFTPLLSIVDSRQLKPSGEIEIKREWNYVRISKAKPPPLPPSPQIPPDLCRPCVNLLTKLVSR